MRRCVLLALVAAACNGELRFDEPSSPDGGEPADASSDAGAALDAAPAGCTSDTECGLPDLHCAVETGACVECLNDGHCLRPEQPRCHGVLHRCVQCGSAGDCDRNEVCERSTNTCVPTCFDGDDCSLTYAGCEISRGLCVDCIYDSDCTGASDGPLCQPANGRCVECRDNLSCPIERPSCDPTSGRCVACLSSASCTDATNPLCDPEELTCVARP